MKELPKRSEAEALLKRTGYVRLGDHSATSMEALDEIYTTRHKNWLAAEKKGFLMAPATTTPASTLPVAPVDPPA